MIKCTHQVLRAVLLYSVSSAVGQNFIYYTITQFNPLVLTTVTPEIRPRCYPRYTQDPLKIRSRCMRGVCPTPTTPYTWQVTTTRKIFSTVYSVMRNPANSLATMQWAGCACVFAGLAVDILVKVVGGQKRVAQAPPPSATNGAAKGSPKTRRTQKVD